MFLDSLSFECTQFGFAYPVERPMLPRFMGGSLRVRGKRHANRLNESNANRFQSLDYPFQGDVRQPTLLIRGGVAAPHIAVSAGEQHLLDVCALGSQSVGMKSTRCSSRATAWNPFSTVELSWVSANRKASVRSLPMWLGMPNAPTVSQTAMALILSIFTKSFSDKRRIDKNAGKLLTTSARRAAPAFFRY